MFVTRNSTTNCLKITQRIKHIMKYFIGQCPSNDQMIRPLNIIQRRNFLNIGKKIIYAIFTIVSLGMKHVLKPCVFMYMYMCFRLIMSLRK